MRKMLFKACGNTQYLFDRVIIKSFDGNYLGKGLGQRTCFVEQDRVGFLHCFKITRPLDDETSLGAFALRCHHGNRA